MAERRLPPVAAIEAALRDLAVHIDHPQTADLSVVVVARLTAAPAPPRSRRPRVALAAALLVVVLLAWPAPRHAVADWLGIGAVRVVRTGDVPAGTGSVLRLGREVSLEEASDRAPFTILGPATMEAPSAIYMGEPSADSVTLLWGEGPGVPGTRRRVSACCSPRCRDPPAASSSRSGWDRTPRSRRRPWVTPRRTGSPGASTSCSTWTSTVERGLTRRAWRPTPCCGSRMASPSASSRA